MVCRYLPIAVGIMVMALLAPTIGDACPSCKSIDDPIVRGFNWSILFLMAMPFTVFGLIGGGVLYVCRHTNQSNNQTPRSNVD